MSGGPLSPESYAEDMQEAAERFDVIRSSPATLLLDLDTPEAVQQYERVLPKVVEHFGAASTQSWFSKSGNMHVLITLKDEQPAAVRLALQAALGSDGVREVLGLKRLENGVSEPSALFRPRGAA